MAIADAKAAADVKPPKTKTAMAPKSKASSPSHPPYLVMIKDAIQSLKERTGSSPYAIAKFIEEKQSHLPSNFKKLMYIQMKKLVAGGKLVKVKNSFKLPAKAKPAAASADATKKPSKPAKVPEKMKKAAGVVTKAKTAPVKAKAVAKPKTKAVERPAKVSKTTAKASPAKVAAAMLKVKKVPAKAAAKKPKSIKSPAKKPRSIKSPAKKAPAKRGKKL